MARPGNGCRTILAGRDRFCHMAVFSCNLEDTDMTPSTRSARLDDSTPIDGSAGLGGSARSRRSLSVSRDARTPASRRGAIGNLAPLAFRADCAVCGSSDVAADEAVHNGLWLLGECGRCGHRWTAGPFDGPLPAPASLRPVATNRGNRHRAPHAA